MKELVYSYLKSLTQKRVKTIDIQNYLYQKLGQKQFLQLGGYSALANTLKQLEIEEVIRPIKAWKTNGKSPILYNGYQYIEKSPQLDQEVRKKLMTQFHPVINVAYYLTHPAEYQKDEHYLNALNVFLKYKQEYRQLEPISVNERSFQIFTDEKFLNSTHGQTLLQRVALSIADLNCYQTHEPFFYYRCYNNQQSLNVLIVENKDTFISLKKLFQRGITTWNSLNFSLLVYGEGWKILKSFKFFYELDFSSSSSPNFYYFGDLDPVGITIWHQLRTAEDIDIKPFVFFYNFLLDKWGSLPLKIRKDQSGDFQALQSFVTFFAQPQSKIIENLWVNNCYIPQEGLNYNFMEMLATR